MSKTIGQIYQRRPIQNAQYALQIWYNDLLKKKEDELTTFDVIRMIRQRKFLDLAVSKALDFLTNDPLVGDCFPGELLEKIVDTDTTIVKQNKAILQRIIVTCKEKIDDYEWSDNDEKIEFKRRLSIIIDKYNNIINEVNNESTQ
ncbi:MAG: contact-dependent growth inhibition system immunity protein [Hominimerdicola sp.]